MDPRAPDPGNLSVALILLLLLLLWIGTMLFNFRGWRDRSFRRTTAVSARLRRAGLNPLGMSEEQHERFARSTQLVVLSILFVSLIVFVIVIAFTLVTG